MFTQMAFNKRVLKEDVTINLSKDIDDILTEYKLNKIGDDYQITTKTKKPLLVKITRVDSIVVKLDLVVEGTTEKVSFFLEKDIWYMGSQSTLFSGNMSNLLLGDAKRMLQYFIEGIRILWVRN
jgi:hypothetical protein